MDRQSILSEIARLEAQKVREPNMTSVMNDQITQLCNKLKQPAFQQRRVV